MLEEGRVRISDIAEELGLSTATVSNVLHGKSGKASDETVRRVLAALEERQYIPSMAAILLARNDSRIIGVVVNDHEKYEGDTLQDVFIAAAINALSTRIEAEGRFMMVKKTRDRAEIIRFASMWNLDGLVLIGYCDADYAYLRSHMRIPFVVYDGARASTEGICNICIDNYDGGFQVGAHLRALGHRRALCVADNACGVDEQRFSGFRAGFGEGARRLLIPMRHAQRWQFYQQNSAYIRQFSAIFAVSDAYAVDMTRFLRAQGVEIGRDISIVGFDDTPICAMTQPALSSVRQDADQRARVAMESLIALKAGEKVEPEIILPVKLMIRESSASARE